MSAGTNTRNSSAPPPGLWVRRVILLLLLVVGGGLSWAVPHYRWLNGYYQMVLVLIGLNIILSVSLNLVNGFMGEFSIGHAGFMAVGAYTSSVLTLKVWHLTGPSWMFPLAVFAGGLAAAFCGLLVAIPSFRTRGDYLAMVTLAFLMIVKSVIENTPYLGGASIMVGMRRLTTLPWLYVWVVLTVCLVRNFVYSRFGRGILAVRDDELAAELMGVGTRQSKLLAFAVSSFFAGVAGALYAHYLQSINPRVFDILKSTDVLIMVYLGGVGSITGSVVGATLYTVLMEFLTPGNLADAFQWLPEVQHQWLCTNLFPRFDVWRMILMPLLLVLVMLFRPRGMMGGWDPQWLIPYRDRVSSIRKKNNP
jgi:branched-chain amino acid transport system permease protein